jgi:hypothetical protein
MSRLDLDGADLGVLATDPFDSLSGCAPPGAEGDDVVASFSASSPTPSNELRNLFPLCKVSGPSSPPPSAEDPRRAAEAEAGMEPVIGSDAWACWEGEGRPAPLETMLVHFRFRLSSSFSF